MQHNESEVSDRELIAALEAYESHEAHVEGQENVRANDSLVADVELLALQQVVRRRRRDCR